MLLVRRHSIGNKGNNKIKMKDSIFKDAKFKLKLLGYYQIVGGVAGWALTICLIAQTITITGLILLLFLVALSLYSFSIYCGIQILKNNKYALNLSLTNQYIQLISFSILGYGFKYVSGLLLSIGFDFTNSVVMKFNMGIMSSWELSFKDDTNQIQLNLNLIALFFIIFIDNLKKSIKECENEPNPSALNSESLPSSSGEIENQHLGHFNNE